MEAEDACLARVYFELRVIRADLNGERFEEEKEGARASKLAGEELRECIQEELDYLRLGVKYLKFDLDAKNREYSWLVKMMDEEDGDAPA